MLLVVALGAVVVAEVVQVVDWAWACSLDEEECSPSQMVLQPRVALLKLVASLLGISYLVIVFVISTIEY